MPGKKIVISFFGALLALFCGAVVLFGGYVTDSAPLEQTSAPVRAVKQFWQDARRGGQDDVDASVSKVPSNFYDDSCAQDRTNSRDLIAVASRQPTWAHDAMAKMVELIRTKQLSIERITSEREAGDQAVVKVTYKYVERENLSVTVTTYFLLTRGENREKEWKVFLVTETPWVLNKNFADPGCKSK